MPNVSVTPEEERGLREAFANFDEHAAVTTTNLTDAAGTQDLFCDNWPTVKQALKFIAGLPFVPQAVKDAIGKVIAGGDLAASVLCGR